MSEEQKPLPPLTLAYEGPEIGRSVINEIESGLVAGLNTLGLPAASAVPGIMKKTVDEGFLELTVRIPVPLLRAAAKEEESPQNELMAQIRAAEREVYGAGVRNAISRAFNRWRSQVAQS